MIFFRKTSKILFVAIILFTAVYAQASMFDSVRSFYHKQLGAVQNSYHEQKGDYYYDKKQYLNAYEHYISASKNNNAYAYFQLFVMLRNGEGVGKDKHKATQMLKEAVRLEYPMAEIILANRLLYQEPTDAKKAISLLKSAARKEYRYAYADLYKVYWNGIGVKRDTAKADQYYRLAKANGLDLKQNSSKKSYSDAPLKGNLIVDIQRGLKKLGFYKSTADGIPGPMTRKSIANFQKFYGYPIDYKVSSQTLKQINSEIK